MEETKKQLEATKSELSALKDAKNELDTTLTKKNELNARVQELAVQLDTKEKKIIEQEAKINDLTASISKVQEENEKQMAELATQKGTDQKTIELIKQEMNQVQQAHQTQLKAPGDQKNQPEIDLENKRGELESKLQDFANYRAAQDQKEQELNKKLSELQTQLDGKVDENSQLQKQLKGMVDGKQVEELKTKLEKESSIVTGKQIGRASCRERVLRLV